MVWRGDTTAQAYDRNEIRRRLFALIAAVLLISSAITAPITAAGFQDTDSSIMSSSGNVATEPSSPNVANPEIARSGNGTLSIVSSIRGPRSLLANASLRLERLNATQQTKQIHLQRAQSRLADTIAGYETQVRPVNHRVFTDAKQSIHGLRQFGNVKRQKRSPTQTRILHAASKEIMDATNRTAALRVLQAEWRLERAESSLSKGTNRSLHNVLEQAQDRLVLSKSLRKKISAGDSTKNTNVRKVLGSRANAISRYRTAWTKATRVLERLGQKGGDVNTTDTDGDGLTDQREIALGTNLSQPDSDADGLSDLTETAGGFPIDSDGDGTIDALDLDSDDDDVPDADRREGTNDTDGDGIANFRDSDDDGDGIPTKREVADGFEFAHDVDFDGTVNWLDTDSDGDGMPDSVEGLSDSDGDGMPDYLDNDKDNDGLPDFYERNVTHTDPANNDSDSSVTSANEADDGKIDGTELHDNDTLTAFQEYSFDTAPFREDTDGDGLSDGFEARRSAFDPTVADTDGDGTVDGAEDPDDDGLTNAQERDASTNYQLPDTDGDGISDSIEVQIGTDPLEPDTDADGLADAAERPLGTDPLDEDTDSDGTLDGNETFNWTVTDNASGVEVTVQGIGAVNATINSKPTFFDESNVSVGPTVRIVNETSFDNATVRIPVEDTAEENLSIYKWNGTTAGRWHAVDTKIENDTAVATVDSFSYFTVIDTDEWTGYTHLPGDNESAEPLNITTLSDFTCAGSCDVANETTLVLGGEPSARTITIEQRSNRYEIVPLSNGQSIEKFYNYGDAEINSPLPVAASDQSRTFFWSGPNGLSLITLHDKPRDGSGAAVSFDFDGLPTRQGSWVVEDDGNDFNDGPTSPDWTWNDDNTDGGAFRGGLSNQTITIHPAFNDQASRNPLTPGTLNGWQVLTGRATDPQTKSLNMDEPVTITIPDEPEESPESDATAGDTGSANWTYRVSDRTTNLTVAYQTEQTNVDPTATITLTDADGTTVEKSLAIGTVGTVQESFDISGLGNDVRFNVSVSGVNARIQVVPTTHSRRDTDGDGLPDSFEERSWVMSNGPGDLFSTNPYDADTDDDGLPDGEEVRFVPVGEGDDIRYRAKTTSNPEKFDTDGDGLSDRQEIVGTNTTVAFEPDVARTYRQAVRNNETDAERHLREITVKSSPLRVNSDSDDLSDTKEVAYGLSPNTADTDGDSLDDDTEVYNQWYARLHDFRPPRITGQLHSDGDRENFRLEFTVRDQSQIGSVQAFKAGEQRAEETHYGTDYHHDTLSWHIESDLAGEFINPVTGWIEPPTARAKATDVHGNEGPKKKFLGPNNFGKGAAGFANADIPIVSEGGAAVFSVASGLAQGVNVFKNDAITTAAVIGNPSEWGPAAQKTAQGLNQLSQMATSSEKRERAMAAMVKHYGERRQQLNPFDEGRKYHDSFAVGYSGGYAASFLVPVAAEAKAAQAAARMPYMAALLRSVNTMKRSIKGVTIGSAMWTGGKIARRMPDVDFNVGRRVSDVELDGRAKQIVGQTADTLRNTPLPRQRRIAKLTRNTGDGDVMEWLTRNVEAPDSDRYQRGLVYLRRTGAEGKQLLSRLRPDARSALLRLREKAGLQRQLTKAWVRGDIDASDIGKATRRYDGLDAEGRAAFDDLVQHEGPDAVSVSGKLDEDAFEDVLKSDLSTARKADIVDSLSAVDQMTSFNDLYDRVGEQAYRLARHLRGDRLETLLRRTDPDTQDILADGSGELDESFDRAVARAADGDTVDSYDQIDNAVRKIDELDGAANRQARELIEETDGVGLKFVDELDDSSLQKVMDLDIDRADELRTAFAQYYDQGYADLDEIESFARHTDSLEGIDGLNSGPVDDFIADADQVPGALHEVDVADDIGADNIGRMNIEVGPNGADGEIDIKLESGEVVEVKRTFGSDKRNAFDEIQSKLNAMRNHPDTQLDDNTLVVRADSVENNDSVREVANHWEKELANSEDWNNANVDIRVVEDSTGEVIDK